MEDMVSLRLGLTRVDEALDGFETLLNVTKHLGVPQFQCKFSVFETGKE